MKTCNACGESKPLSEFYPHNPACKACCNKARSEARSLKLYGDPHYVLRQREERDNVPQGFKRCSQKPHGCGELKPLSAFHLRDGKPLARCKGCVNRKNNDNYHARKSDPVYARTQKRQAAAKRERNKAERDALGLRTPRKPRDKTPRPKRISTDPVKKRRADGMAQHRAKVKAAGFVSTKLKGLPWLYKLDILRIALLQGGCAICGALSCKGATSLQPRPRPRHWATERRALHAL